MVFLFRPILQKSDPSYPIVSCHYSDLTARVTIYTRGELSRATKSLQIELRQLISFIHSIHDSNPNSNLNMISLISIVLPVLNLPETIRDHVNGSRNIQGFVLIRAVFFTLYFLS